MRVSAGTPTVTTHQMGRGTMKSAFFGAAATFALMAGGTAQAEQFKFGDIDVSIDTTVSLGMTMRTSARSCEHVSQVNGGCASSSGR